MLSKDRMPINVVDGKGFFVSCLTITNQGITSPQELQLPSIAKCITDSVTVTTDYWTALIVELLHSCTALYL